MKRGLYLFTALAIVALAAWILLSGRQEKHLASQEASSAPPATAAPINGTGGRIVTDEKASDITTEKENGSTPAAIKPLLSYREETQAIASLVAQLPKSKPILLEMIEKEDIFKKPNIQIEEHSINEIMQNQIGATKVMALRALMKAEKNPSIIKQDIDHIIQNAKDTTIVKIAKAARDSIDKGQHFPEDLLNGIDQMSLKN